MVTGMCAGNTDEAAEPDIVCAAHSSLKHYGPRGRTQEECCEVSWKIHHV